MRYYKFLAPDRMPCHGGSGQWPEPGITRHAVVEFARRCAERAKKYAASSSDAAAWASAWADARAAWAAASAASAARASADVEREKQIEDIRQLAGI